MHGVINLQCISFFGTYLLAEIKSVHAVAVVFHTTKKVVDIRSRVVGHRHGSCDYFID